MPEPDAKPLTTAERKDVEERAAPRSPVIHETVRLQGDEELGRPLASLFWSGAAAGMAIMTSVVVEGALARHIPQGMPGREALLPLGYSTGFLMVILGRMQLFTEQTVVSVLPVMARGGAARLGALARLWSVVFLANLLGAALAAWMNVHLQLVSAELLDGMLEVAARLQHRPALELLRSGVPAGFLIASVAWLRAGANGSEFLIILVFTYAIGVAGFAHAVAGAAEAFLLLAAGHIDAAAALAIILPAALGNIIGGTGLFALLAHAQVRKEL